MSFEDIKQGEFVHLERVGADFVVAVRVGCGSALEVELSKGVGRPKLKTTVGDGEHLDERTANLDDTRTLFALLKNDVDVSHAA